MSDASAVIEAFIKRLTTGQLSGAAGGASLGMLVDIGTGGITLGAASAIGAGIGYCFATGIGGVGKTFRKRKGKKEAEAAAALAEQEARAEAERTRAYNQQAVDRAQTTLAIFGKNGYEQGKNDLEKALE